MRLTSEAERLEKEVQRQKNLRCVIKPHMSFPLAALHTVLQLPD